VYQKVWFLVCFDQHDASQDKLVCWKDLIFSNNANLENLKAMVRSLFHCIADNDRKLFDFLSITLQRVLFNNH